MSRAGMERTRSVGQRWTVPILNNRDSGSRGLSREVYCQNVHSVLRLVLPTARFTPVSATSCAPQTWLIDAGRLVDHSSR